MFVFVTQLLSNIQSAFYLLILSKEIVFVQTEKGSVLGDNVSKSECLATSGRGIYTTRARRAKIYIL
jgi:hypothetical protein